MTRRRGAPNNRDHHERRRTGPRGPRREGISLARTVQRLAGFALLWTVVGLFFGVQVYVDHQYAGRPIRFDQAVYLALVDWYLWALCYPLIAAVARRAPLARGTWLKSVAIHLPFTLALVLLKNAMEMLVVRSTAPGLYRAPTLAGLNASLLTCWLLVGVGQAVVHYRAARARERRALKLEGELSRARLRLLELQLQPHFLFNTLHAIATLMHRDVPAAEKMLTQLSELLRMTLERGDRQRVRLKEELEFARLYLEIQATRFGERLRVAYRVTPDALDALVPVMVLQPLVENAVTHAIAPRSRGGTIEIRAAVLADRLTLEVADDGPGLPAGAVPRQGVGLANTRSRLDHLYGDDHALALRSPRGGGLTVTLELPVDFGGNGSERSRGSEDEA